VLAPAEDVTGLPGYVVPTGRSLAIRYNGSVARLGLGPAALARVRRWLRNGVNDEPFDLLHVHEPLAPSLSLLACLAFRGPIVATFHTSVERSRALAAAEGFLQPVLEKITGRIAVSRSARKVQVEHLAGGGVEIPNGVAVRSFATAEPLPGWPGAGGAIGFLGRFTEPRKGFAVLADAYVRLAARRPALRLLVAGPGDPADLFAMVPTSRTDILDRIVVLTSPPLRHQPLCLDGPSRQKRVTQSRAVSEADKARMLRSVDVFVAPNTGGESFGLVLTEAMAAGTPVVASDLEAFRQVIGGAGRLFRAGDAGQLAEVLDRLLDDADERAALARRASVVVAAFDWELVVDRVVEVYELVVSAGALTGSAR
jgi:phosphatidylinositol alpha-mannosyltransferase